MRMPDWENNFKMLNKTVMFQAHLIKDQMHSLKLSRKMILSMSLFPRSTKRQIKSLNNLSSIWMLSQAMVIILVRRYLHRCPWVQDKTPKKEHLVSTSNILWFNARQQVAKHFWEFSTYSVCKITISLRNLDRSSIFMLKMNPRFFFICYPRTTVCGLNFWTNSWI